MRRTLPLLLCLALAAVAVVSAQETPPAPAAPTAPTKSGFQVTKGDTLTSQDEAEVRKALLGYLAAVKKLDWRKAADYVDRESFLASVEPLLEQASPNPAFRNDKRREIFGVSTPDSLAQKPLNDLFFSMMTYATVADPTKVAILEKAEIEVIGIRKVRGKVHVAYSLTIPADSDTTQPYVGVTTERLRKVGDDWKIVIVQDQGAPEGTP